MSVGINRSLLLTAVIIRATKSMYSAESLFLYAVKNGTSSLIVKVSVIGGGISKEITYSILHPLKSGSFPKLVSK